MDLSQTNKHIKNNATGTPPPLKGPNAMLNQSALSNSAEAKCATLQSSELLNRKELQPPRNNIHTIEPPKMFYKKMFLESLANLQENTCTRVSFLNMVASCRGFQKKKKKRIVVEFYLISANFQLRVCSQSQNIAQPKS